MTDDISIVVSTTLDKIQSDIDALQVDLAKKFVNERDIVSVTIPNEDHFICKNIFWDLWFKKLFAQFISVKLWIIILITVLLSVGLITSIQFASILGIIMGLKGTFQVAEVWKNRFDDSNAMDKT